MIEMEKDSVNIRVSMAKSQPADRAERVECKKRSIYYTVFLPHPPFLSGKEEGGGKSEYVLNHLNTKKKAAR